MSDRRRFYSCTYTLELLAVISNLKSENNCILFKVHLCKRQVAHDARLQFMRAPGHLHRIARSVAHMIN